MAKTRKSWTPKTIKALRERLDLTQKEAGAKVRASQQLWAEWESGRRVPTPAYVLLLDMLASGQLPAEE